MKKLAFLLIFTFLACSRDNLKDVVENSTNGSVQLSVNLGNFFIGGSGTDSPWAHHFQENVDLTFSSTTSVYTKTVSFNPNDLSTFPDIELPYDIYTWSIDNIGTEVALSSVLYIYGNSSSNVTIDAPSTTIPLVLETDFALVTISTENLNSAGIRYNGTNTDMTIQDGYYYGYINSNNTDYIVNIVDTNDQAGVDTIATPEAYTHYNYQLTQSSNGAINVSISLIQTFVLEDRQISTSFVDADLDGVLDTIDNCLNFYNPDQQDLNLNGIGDSCEENFTELPLDFENKFIDYFSVINHLNWTTSTPRDELKIIDNIYRTSENNSDKIFQVIANNNDPLSSCYDDGLQIFFPSIVYETVIKFKIYTETNRYLHLNYAGPGYSGGASQFLVEGKNEWQTITYDLTTNFTSERGIDEIILWYNTDYFGFDPINNVEIYEACNNSNGNVYFDDFEMITDSDLDGVPDELDQCPNSPPIGKVNSTGCLENGENIFLSENGLTARASLNSEVGDTAVINGTDYIIVDEETLREIVYSTNRGGMRINLGDVSHVVTTKVQNMDYLFEGLGSLLLDSRYDGPEYDYLREIYEKDLKSWDVSNVTTMEGTFREAYLNSDLKYWDTSNVVNMKFMFNSTVDFNYDLSSWNVEQVNNCEGFSDNSTDWVSPKPNFLNCNTMPTGPIILRPNQSKSFFQETSILMGDNIQTILYSNKPN